MEIEAIRAKKVKTNDSTWSQRQLWLTPQRALFPHVRDNLTGTPGRLREGVQLEGFTVSVKLGTPTGRRWPGSPCRRSSSGTGHLESCSRGGPQDGTALGTKVEGRFS